MGEGQCTRGESAFDMFTVGTLCCSAGFHISMNKLWRSQKGGKWLVGEWRELGREGSDFPLAAPIDTFITVGNVEEKVLFVVLLGHKAKCTLVPLTM